MNPKIKIVLAICSLLLALLACQNSTSDLPPEAVSTNEPVATSLPSIPTATDIPTALPTATDIATALPVATLTPPLGLFSGKVVFTDTSWHLALLDMLTGQIKPLTEGENYDGKPYWSSNGDWIAFMRRDLAAEKSGLYVLEVASGEVRQITENFHPKYSFIFDMLYVAPDGQFVILEDDGPIPDGFWDVYRADTVTREVTNLTADSSEPDDKPALSPDGTQIAFRRTDPSSKFDIWVMNADGSGKRNLTPNDEYYWDESLPAWSPDGARIAFFRSYLPCGSCTLPDPTQNTHGWPPGLWVVNADGSGQELIAELPLNEMPKLLTSSWLVWSPDGRYLTYLYGNQGGLVRIVEVATGEYFHVARFSSDAIYLELPTWSPDSRALMLNHSGWDGEKSRFTVYVASVDESGVWTLFDGTRDQSGSWTLFTTLGGHDASWSP